MYPLWYSVLVDFVPVHDRGGKGGGGGCVFGQPVRF